MRAGGRSPAALKKLAGLLEERGEPKQAMDVLNRLNHIFPRDEDLHRRLGDLRLAAGDAEGAIREYNALLAMAPLDRAASHFSLARAYRMAEKREEAKEQVLLSLEAAPSYRPAQRLLLELSQ
jgi:tetratricopeptide (TPR) repeat protein